MRPFEHLQKSQLQLLRLHAVHLVEGRSERLDSLPGQPRDQIQVLVDIVPAVDTRRNPANLPDIRAAADLPQRLRVGGLYADLQLHQAGAHLLQQLHLLLVQQVGGNLKMEIGHAVVMLLDMPPYGESVAFLTVKGAVHKFHLGHLSLQKPVQLPLYQGNGPETQRLVHGGQTVGAGKRAASAALIVDDPMLQILQSQLFVRKWK